jgi:hypothetical protein
MRHHFAVRIETTELALRIHAWDAARDYRLGIVGIDMPAQVDEFLVGPLRDALGQHVLRYAERLRQFRQAFRMLQQFLRVGPDRLHRRRHRQRFAVAVDDHAARGRDRHFAQEAGIALVLVKILVEQLHLRGATDQHDRTQAEHATQHQQARFRLIGTGADFHGLITTMSAPSGDFMPSFSVATCSMRLVSDQVACSSCKRLNSMLSSSRSFSSRVSST